jgi:hypothetical protein
MACTTGRDPLASRTLLYPAARDRTSWSVPPRRSRAPGPPAETPDCPMIPGRRSPVDPGSPGVRRHPAGSPAISPPVLEPGGIRRPGRAPVHLLRRDHDQLHAGGRSPCGRHDGRGRQRTTAIQEDLSAADARVRAKRGECINIRPSRLPDRPWVGIPTARKLSDNRALTRLMRGS